MPIALLANKIQPYAWGSRTVIASLQHRPSPSAGPEAELWLGAHPSAPSQATLSDRSLPLSSLVAEDPKAWLGLRADEFDRCLPFLLKVLAAETPLSLQAHPNAEQARRGYQEDEALGIPKTDRARRYQDAHHKPELLCALTPFQALCGFRSVAEVLTLFAPLALASLKPALDRLRAQPNALGLREFLAFLLCAEESERLIVVRETVAACIRLMGTASAYEKSYAWSVRLSELYPDDAGVVSQLLLNLVELAPGEAIYLPAGNLHAYLAGAGIEIMANSDNVLRGGLTPKPIHIGELLEILDFSPLTPTLIQPRLLGPEAIYRTPAKEFQLSRVELQNESWSCQVHSAEIWLCLQGSVELKAGSASSTLSQGLSAAVSADTSELTLTGSAVLFRATVGPSA